MGEPAVISAMLAAALLLFAVLSLVAFIAMTISNAVEARPELADIDPFALRIAAKMSQFCFYFFTAATLFLVGCIPFYAFGLLVSS